MVSSLKVCKLELAMNLKISLISLKLSEKIKSMHCILFMHNCSFSYVFDFALFIKL